MRAVRIILALDLGARTGFAAGETGGKPRLESWVLKRAAEPIEVACSNLARSLRDNIRLERPDLIAVERYLPSAASQSAAATESQLQLHGVVLGIAGVFGIRVVRPTTAQFRLHFCGQANAAAPRRRGVERTKAQRAADREATNAMVVQRAILLGYLERGSTDWDKANAAGIWDWAAATYGRNIPKALVLFGERESAR